MPADKPTPDYIWDEKITFLSLDTDILQSAGFHFDKGALNQLPHQLPESMELQLTQVIMEEVKNHRLRPVIKAVEQLSGAAQYIQRTTSVDMRDIDTRIQGMNIINQAKKGFDQELHDYAARCNGGILSWDALDAATLFADYFEPKAPFESSKEKKAEFPDAASLQLLQQYAEDKDTMGIVVSGDRGWGAFANDSDRLYYVNSLDELTALFVATGKSTDVVKAKIAEYIKNPESVLYKAIQEAVSEHIRESSWDASELFAASGDRLDANVYEAEVLSCELDDDVEVWRDQDESESWVMEFTAYPTVNVHTTVEFYKWDSIDREELRIASNEVEIQESVDVRVYLTCSSVRLDTSPDEWDIDIDIAPADYSLESAEIDYDFD